jgi:REP element-mobilizing transposase RayT
MTSEGRAGPLGPPLPTRKPLPHQTPGWVKSDAIFFVTICCQPRGLNQLCHESVATVLFEAVTFRNRTKRWFAHLVLLMPDHLHALVTLPAEEAMKKVIANFKEVTAKQTGIAWQRDFFDHRLRAEESFREKADYILLNPVRKGLVKTPDQWTYVWTPEEGNGGPGGPALPRKHAEFDGGPAGPALPRKHAEIDGGPAGPALPE